MLYKKWIIVPGLIILLFSGCANQQSAADLNTRDYGIMSRSAYDLQERLEIMAKDPEVIRLESKLRDHGVNEGRVLVIGETTIIGHMKPEKLEEIKQLLGTHSGVIYMSDRSTIEAMDRVKSNVYSGDLSTGVSKDIRYILQRTKP